MKRSASSLILSGVLLVAAPSAAAQSAAVDAAAASADWDETDGTEAFDLLVSCATSQTGGGAVGTLAARQKANLVHDLFDQTLDAAPARFALEQSTPNPTAGTGEMRFAPPEAVRVRLMVIDVTGCQVARGGDRRLPHRGRRRRGHEAADGRPLAGLEVG